MHSGTPNASPRPVSTIRRGTSHHGDAVQKITAGEVRWHVQLTFALSLLVVTNNPMVGARKVGMKWNGNTVQNQPIAAPLTCTGMETIRPQKQLKERTLDPVDWPEFRQFAHRVLGDAISYASGIR
jgi:hypothetical protein